MATTDPPTGRAILARTRKVLLAGRPMVGLVAVLLTTGGHTMNLRELGASQGWVADEVYALQTCYLLSLALTMLAGPNLGQRFTSRNLIQWGLVLAVIGSIMNVIEVWEPLYTFLAARVVAGVGAGLVIFFTPTLLGSHWKGPVAWALILCPVAGTGAISAATMMYESSEWRYGFGFEGAMAAVGLIALLSMGKIRELRPRPPQGTLAYLPALVVAAAALVFVLHWGQLHGWLESPDIATATAVFILASAVSLTLMWHQLNWTVLGENWLRLVLYFFGGMCQFFYGYLMNVYGGTLVNLSSWERALLIWPLPIGIAVALTVGGIALPHLHRIHGRVIVSLPTAIVGLLSLSGGLYLCYSQMLEWPYWSIRDVAELNWFPAPGSWELAPGRFLMGLGIGLFMSAMDTQFSPDPHREKTVRPFLNVFQFCGGALAAAVLVNFLSIGQKVHYSYSSERDTIQAAELQERVQMWTDVLRQAGHADPEASARVLLYRFINYESSNLVFATIYAAFMLAALGVAGLCIWVWLWRHLHR